MIVNRWVFAALFSVMFILGLAACDNGGSGGTVENETIEIVDGQIKHPIVGTWKYTKDNTGPITDTRILTFHSDGKWEIHAMLMEASGTWHYLGKSRIVMKCTSCTPAQSETMLITWHSNDLVTLHDPDGSWVQMIRQ